MIGSELNPSSRCRRVQNVIWDIWGCPQLLIAPLMCWAQLSKGGPIQRVCVVMEISVEVGAPGI
jgi:hypothetical protein